MGGDWHGAIGHKWDDDKGFCQAKVENHMDEWGYVPELNVKQEGCTEGCLLWREHGDAEWKGLSAVVAESSLGQRKEQLVVSGQTE